MGDKELISSLLRELLKASGAPNSILIDSLLGAVSAVLPTKLCSLWKINHQHDTLSLQSRYGLTNLPENPESFVHQFSDSLIEKCVADIKQLRKPFYEIDDVRRSEFWEKHKGKDRVERLGLKRLVSIPIRDHDSNQNEYSSILNIYLPDHFHFNTSLAEILCEHFSIALSRQKLISRECLTGEIIGIYEKRAKKDLASVLFPIINELLKSYINYEGCSVFILDPFYNRFALTQTTGIEKKPKKSSVFYDNEEGLTGFTAKTRKPLSLRDLSDLKGRLFEQHKAKYQEITTHPSKSFLSIPIRSPSRANEILGVIRFVNKLNPNAEVVDQFDNDDVKLISHACNLIALYAEYEQSERIRTSYAMQMAHEMHTPSVAIKGTASRLSRRWKEERFQSIYMDRYLNDILDQASLQLTLTRTIEYIWKGASDTPRNQVYQVEYVNLNEVNQISKRLVIPIARAERLTFDRIKIEGNFPKIYIDRYALEQVIFNLLTNAIKYRRLSEPGSFGVIVESQSVDYLRDFHRLPLDSEIVQKHKKNKQSGCLVTFSDNGIGIPESEREKIFLLGYRMSGIQRTHIRGLGMGLFVARKILNDFDCDIWVSKTRNPTVFSIFFPDKLKNNDYVNKPEWASSREVTYDSLGR